MIFFVRRAAIILNGFGFRIGQNSNSHSVTQQQQVDVSIDADITVESGPPPVASGAQIYLPRGTILNNTRFATCTLAILEAKRPELCKSARVGTGKALSSVFFPGSPPKVIIDKICANLTAYNIADNQIALYVKANRTDDPDPGYGCAKRSPADVTVVISGKFMPPSDPRYGPRLLVKLKLPQPIPGADLTAHKLRIDIGASRKVRDSRTKRLRSIPYLGAPLSCPQHGWPFQGVFTGFYGDQTRVAAGTLPCR